MEHNPTNHDNHNQEQAPTTPPRVYAASLSDYNNGRLHGVWIDATDDVDTINAAIAEMLRRSIDPVAEEFAIHDYEGFYGFSVGEYDSVELIHRIAEGISEHGEAYAAFVSLVGTQEANLDSFTDCYRGTYRTTAEWVDEFVESMGWIDELNEFQERSGAGPFVSFSYDDLEAVLRMEWDVIEGDDGIHIFQP